MSYQVALPVLTPKDYAHVAGMLFGFPSDVPPPENNGFFWFVRKNDPLAFLCALLGMLSDHVKV